MPYVFANKPDVCATQIERLQQPFFDVDKFFFRHQPGIAEAFKFVGEGNGDTVSTEGVLSDRLYESFLVWMNWRRLVDRNGFNFPKLGQLLIQLLIVRMRTASTHPNCVFSSTGSFAPSRCCPTLIRSHR